MTRVAELDELAKANRRRAIDEDIGRLARGGPALVFYDADIERLRQEKAALIELEKRAAGSGCPGSTTVIEAVFPDGNFRKNLTVSGSSILGVLPEAMSGFISAICPSRSKKRFGQNIARELLSPPARRDAPTGTGDAYLPF
jgi:hypothetical protein